MHTLREIRLFSEFEGMKALRSPHSLFDFRCADLSPTEAGELLRAKTSFDIIKEGLSGFMEPEVFERKHPDMPPEKFLVLYTCKGLVRAADGTISEVSQHLMEVVFGWNYPSKPPTFIWLSDIWHPNFKTPYICIEGHPFAIGLTLDQIVPEVGRMIQYQNYNVNDPLNREAAQWAHENAKRFPVDERDILDSRRRVGAKGKNAPIVELISDDPEVELILSEDESEPLIGLIKTDNTDVQYP